MTATWDAVVVGAGANGLVSACCLAKAGRRVLLLERGEAAGGQGGVTEFAPGFRAVPLCSDAGWLPPPVSRALGLPPMEIVVPDPTIAVPAGSREWLVLSSDMARAAEAIRRYSPGDAEQWSPFCTRIAKLAGFLEALYTLPPPDIDSSALADLVPLLGLARKFRGLGKQDMVELLRIMPMSVRELLDDRFEGGPLKAAIAAGGIRDIRQGPRSGGTAFVLLHHQVGAPKGAIRGRGYWKTGPDALNTALIGLAQRLGVTTRTASEVAQVVVRDDRVVGVVLADGEEIATDTVLSSADPARTLLAMVDPVWLDPEFLLAVRNIKLRGNSARVLYALDALPEFAGLPDPGRTLAGTLSLTASLDALEHAADAAKYGRISERPHVELQLPSVRWAGLAPAGKHVLVATVQSAPYRLREGEWTEERRSALGDRVTAAIGDVAPGFATLVRHREVLVPADIEVRYGLTEGAVTQGEMTLDQILFMRPVAGASRYATPLAGLYLSGAGTHPGSGIAGGPGWLAARRVLADRGRR
jgi:phytoene dehydrogenase-like protein